MVSAAEMKPGVTPALIVLMVAPEIEVAAMKVVVPSLAATVKVVIVGTADSTSTPAERTTVPAGTEGPAIVAEAVVSETNFSRTTARLRRDCEIAMLNILSNGS